MSCIITYKGQKYSEEQFKEYFINNKQEFASSISKNKDVVDSFKRKMEGINFVFSQSPELASIGSKAQYLQYLSTIFPNSKVKDIVYHGFKLKKDDYGRDDLPIQTFNKKLAPKGFYFTTDKDYAQSFTEKFTNVKQTGIIQVIVNLKNPKQQKDLFRTSPEIATKEGKDGFVGNDMGFEKENVVVVFEPEQIHILSSKKDLEMFRNFINFTKSEYAKYGDIQQFKDYIMSKNFAAIEEFLVVNNKIDRKC